MAQPRAEILDARPLRSGEQGRTPLAGGGLCLLWPLAGQLLAVRSFRPSEQTSCSGARPHAAYLAQPPPWA